DRAPSITQPSVSQPLYVASTAVCTPGVYSDPDGDLENTAARAFTWYKNGAAVPGNNASTLVLSSIGAVVGDKIACRETATNSVWPATATNLSANVSVVNTSVAVAYSAGWNMVSVPVTVADNTTTAIWPEGASSLYAYTNGYTSVSQAAYGQGYWLKFNSNSSKTYEGGNLPFVNTTLNYRWNIIGSISVPVNLSSIKTEPADLLVSDFWGFNGGYYRAEILEPGRAYWVKSNQPGRLILGAAPTNQIQSTSTAGMSSLTVTDNSKKKLSVYLGNSAKPDLPPKYSGVYDVRYATDRYIESLPSSSYKEYNISISSAAYPVTLSWNLQAGYAYSLSYIRGGVKKTVAVSGKGSMTISDPSVQLVTLRATKATTVSKVAS
ncbi:MAG: hypothetical protein QW568_03970, partial [Candidatus Anstonellaceae archaeon]